MGMFSSKEDKMQELEEQLELSNLSDRDYALAKIALKWDSLANAQGVLVSGIEGAKLASLRAQTAQNWLIIKQLNELNQNIKELLSDKY